MSLRDLWTDPQYQKKSLWQLLSLAGDGHLTDGSQCSLEYREFLSNLDSRDLVAFSKECLFPTKQFADAGLALQDIVNEVGRRMTFDVTSGRYRGQQNLRAPDGIWHWLQANRTLIVETKTSDAYRLRLSSTFDPYEASTRVAFPDTTEIAMLIVVGNIETQEIEDQIRGSQYARKIRIVGLPALLRLMQVSEELDDEATDDRIFKMLFPLEYTNLDPLVDLVFTAIGAAETAEQVQPEGPISAPPTKKAVVRTIVPVSFQDSLVERMESKLKMEFFRKSRSMFASGGDDAHIVVVASREYETSKGASYWCALHKAQAEFISQAASGFYVMGCGSPEQAVAFPWKELEANLHKVSRTVKEDREWWHIYIDRVDGRFSLRTTSKFDAVDITGLVL